MLDDKRTLKFPREPLVFGKQRSWRLLLILLAPLLFGISAGLTVQGLRGFRTVWTHDATGVGIVVSVREQIS